MDGERSDTIDTIVLWTVQKKKKKGRKKEKKLQRIDDLPTIRLPSNFISPRSETSFFLIDLFTRSDSANSAFVSSLFLPTTLLIHASLFFRTTVHKLATMHFTDANSPCQNWRESELGGWRAVNAAVWALFRNWNEQNFFERVSSLVAAYRLSDSLVNFQIREDRCRAGRGKVY